MGLKDLFKKKEEKREEQTVDEDAVGADLLRALLNESDITRDTIMSVPSIAACLNKISDTVASLEVKLYKRDGEKVEEVQDNRVRLLNEETGDTLTAYQFKKAMIEDMFLGKGGYAYVYKTGTEVRSIHYVKEEKVSFLYNADPIFKDYKIQIEGYPYEGFDFIKLLRNTRNGWRGTSILEDSKLLMSVLQESQKYEQNLVKTGGNKRGFLSATSRITQEALTKLKNAFKKLYSNSTSNVIFLNDGVEFKEASNTSVEMQLNENKQTNNNDVCKVFLIPPPIINGNATESDKQQYYEGCIVPILNNFAKAISAVMLREDEKSSYFFAFDVSELLKGDIEKRYKAYEIALKNGFMQLDEVRKEEKLPAFGLKFIKLGLQDVIFYPETNQIYTPNTNKLSVMGENPMDNIVAPVQQQKEEKGGEEDESRN